MSFTPSPYQKAIFDKIENTDESLIIEAVAGSGAWKSPTLAEKKTVAIQAAREKMAA